MTMTMTLMMTIRMMMMMMMMNGIPDIQSTGFCSRGMVSTANIFSRAPSVSCATRLMFSICLFFIFFYPGISSELLNLSQQKFAR